MRIGLITTINTNIGDDFIREGICKVLRKVFKNHKLEFLPVNKHQPLTVYPFSFSASFTKIVNILPRGRHRVNLIIRRTASKLRLSIFDSCDLIVQCGAPFIWQGCHRCEWAEPIWYEVVGRLYEKKPIINLAAGSCYPWEQQPSEVTDLKDAQFIRTVLNYCCLTTVRDQLAQRLCISLDKQTPLIPCSAILSASDSYSPLREDGLILINYMGGGGHYDWGQKVDASEWRSIVNILIDRLKKRHKLAFLCHNEAEYCLAEELDLSIPRMWPKNSQEYFKVVSDAKVALCNRMHASVGLAGLGIPSVAIGTDTRILMVQALGLPCWYVKDATADLLEEELENLLTHRYKEQERLLNLRSKTWKDYFKIVSENL